MVKTLLLVEDDAILGQVTESKLKARGYNVEWVQNEDDAKNRLETQAFELIILDLVLDKSNSLSLIPIVLLRNPESKILMLTGFASIATAVEAVKLGAHNYLPKPATISEILSALGEGDGLAEGGASDQNISEGHENSDVRVLSPKRLEWEHIQRVLQKNNGNVSATARDLNMHRRTLQRKLQKNPAKE